MSNRDEACVFCRIAAGQAQAWIVHEDARCLAFLDQRQVRPGHTMVIPRQHVDPFQDLEDDLAAHILHVAQRIARKIRKELQPPRVGYVVAGFGVAHAHLHVQPLWDEHDITSQRYLDRTQTPPVFDARSLPMASDEERQTIRDRIRLGAGDA